MSDKKIYDLHDEVQLRTDAGLRYFTVEEWIKRHPDQLYQHVYRASKKGLYKYQLNEVAIRLLKLALQEHFPELYTELLINKAKWNSRMREREFKVYSRLIPVNND